jgi:nucleotide-binding universal stress UspA family protein
MAKYTRLLVGVDGSAASLHALKEAFKLASSWVTVVAVAPFYEGDLRLMGVPGAARLTREPCDTALAQAMALAEAAGAVIQTVCERGEAHERIVALAEAGSRDLIVLGVRGHSFMERLLVGSVTQRVIGFSPRDVLAVPERAAIGWDRLLLATDGSAPGEAATDRALDLAQAYGGELLVVSTLDLAGGLLPESPPAGARLLQSWEDQVARVRDRAQALGLKSRGFVQEGPPYEVITRLARKEGASLIVMGSHGRTGLQRLLMGRVTERVLGQASCPVLVVKKS